MFNIWSINRHSISESDIPIAFKNKVVKTIDAALLIVKSKDIPESVKDEIYFFLSCLHKDAPQVVIDRLTKIFLDKELLEKYKIDVARAIGNAELPWQKELLKNTVQLVNKKQKTINIGMDILRVVVWQSEEAVSQLPEVKIRILIDELFIHLSRNLKNFINDRTNNLFINLEFLLALMRARQNIEALLDPREDLTRKYIKLIDEISQEASGGVINLKSRIDIEIDKPEAFKHTPNLLYALRCYLTAEFDTNSIQIKGISSDLSIQAT